MKDQSRTRPVVPGWLGSVVAVALFVGLLVITNGCGPSRAVVVAEPSGTARVVYVREAGGAGTATNISGLQDTGTRTRVDPPGHRDTGQRDLAAGFGCRGIGVSESERTRLSFSLCRDVSSSFFILHQ